MILNLQLSYSRKSNYEENKGSIRHMKIPDICKAENIWRGYINFSFFDVKELKETC